MFCSSYLCDITNWKLEEMSDFSPPGYEGLIVFTRVLDF